MGVLALALSTAGMLLVAIGAVERIALAVERRWAGHATKQPAAPEGG